jgi:hypothetical protein
MWITLNQQDVSTLVSHLAGFVCLALSLFSVWIISLAVARPASEVPDETIFQKLKALAVAAPAETAKPAPATLNA